MCFFALLKDYTSLYMHGFRKERMCKMRCIRKYYRIQFKSMEKEKSEGPETVIRWRSDVVEERTVYNGKVNI